MNHRSITTTSRYSHVGFDVLRTAVETLVKKED
jgi:site-specific recombinase XerD